MKAKDIFIMRIKFSQQVIEPILRLFNNDLVIRWRLWKMNWFPYRTAEWLGFDEWANDDDAEINLGEWKWNAPLKWRRFKEARNASRQSPNSK